MIKLILVPGLLCTRELFKNQIYALENICDIEIANTLGMSSILDMAQNIVRNEPSEFVICGLSMGGYVAQMVAHLAPEKVIAMGLLSTSGRADTEEMTDSSKVLLKWLLMLVKQTLFYNKKQ